MPLDVSFAVMMLLHLFKELPGVYELVNISGLLKCATIQDFINLSRDYSGNSKFVYYARIDQVDNNVFMYVPRNASATILIIAKGEVIEIVGQGDIDALFQSEIPSLFENGVFSRMVLY